MEPLCRRCGKKTRLAAQIAPMGGRTGLLVFVCDGCGIADSALIEAEKWDQVVRPADRTKEV